MLEAGDASAAGVESLTKRLYQHPLVRNLMSADPELARGTIPKLGRGLPSYIPSKTFAIALIDVLQNRRTPSTVTGAARILASGKALIDGLPQGRLRSSLELLLSDIDALEQDLDKRATLASERIETWFNDRMARASGWYKRHAQLRSLALGAALTIAFNADTLNVATRLWRDSALRAVVASSAQGCRDTQAADLVHSGLPLGWTAAMQGQNLALAPIGWMLTMLAISLGATFWFDVLGKVLQLRGSGVKVSAVTGRVGSEGV